MAATSMTLKRLNREIADLKKEDLCGMTLEPSEDNLRIWRASIPGPVGSPYEGGVFQLRVELKVDYPFSAPSVNFVTKIYHMNISSNGAICIDVLKQNWSPALSLYKVLLSLSSLLTDPNPSDPLVPAIAQEYLHNRQKHDETARNWTRLYAQPPNVKQDSNETASNPKGKGKASSRPSTRSSDRSRRTSGGTSSGGSEEIVIDVDAPNHTASGSSTNLETGRPNTRTRSGEKRKRDGSESEKSDGSRRKRPTDGDDGVIVIED